MFQCDACSFKCEIESDLNTHIVSAHKVHNEELPSVDQILCDVCSKQFENNDLFDGHVCVRTQGNNKVLCNKCEYKTSEQAELNEHMKQHTRSSNQKDETD